MAESENTISDHIDPDDRDAAAETAAGRDYADLVVTNGRIVNVYTKEIYAGSVAVKGERIVAVGDAEYTIGPQTQIVDAEGLFITPGFVDAHIHPESTSLDIREFASVVLSHGTTTIFTDLHEVGVVAGLQGISLILDEAEQTDLGVYFVVPSHVPFSPELETTAGKFDTSIIEQALDRPDAVGLSEIVSIQVLAKHKDLLKSLALARSRRSTLQGHLPELSGKDLNTVLSYGITTDHEAKRPEQAVEKLRAGLHVMLREGSIAHNFTAAIRLILNEGLDLSRVSLVTDDLHTIDAVRVGHLDHGVRTALQAGVDFISAISLVTLNPARAFNLDNEVGGLSAGKKADILVTTGPDAFTVKTVISHGRLVFSHGQSQVQYADRTHNPRLLHTARLLHPVDAHSLVIPAPENVQQATVRAIGIAPGFVKREGLEFTLPVSQGHVASDPEQDVALIAEVERYGINGNIGRGFIHGFGLRYGAIASSVAHDNHNVVVLGHDPADMAIAVNRVIELGGGQVFVDSGTIKGEIAYPILGLLSELPAEQVVERKLELQRLIHEAGSVIEFPFMFLSFVPLAAGPGYSITDHGFVYSAQQRVIDPIVDFN